VPEELEFDGYSYVYLPSARRVRDQLPQELLPKLVNVIDDLAANPDQYPSRVQILGKGANGDLVLYHHLEFPLEIMYEIDRKHHKIYFQHFAAPIVELKKVFLSYSREDMQWLDRLRKFLKPLEDRGLVRIWDDRLVEMGANWREEIEKSLRSAKMAVFLVTQDFLNSQFIQTQELPVLLERAKQEGVKIAWIYVKSCNVGDSVLYRYEAANDPKQPLEMLAEPQQNLVLTQIYEKIKAAVA
jgi:hypothetical protein